jgi:hypothetical protein
MLTTCPRYGLFTLSTNGGYTDTMTPKQRTAQLKRIIKQMGGRLDGNNIENYTRIANTTCSSVATVKSWLLNDKSRTIPAIKLQALQSWAG